MEARQFPYESKPCDGWAATKELLDQTTLLLVAQVGPTVFNVRDQEGSCWRVTIGNPHRCTCYPEEPFCIHVLYVILKVLQVPATNPLAWQRSYTDADIDQVLAGRLRQLERRVANRRTRSAPQRLDGRAPATKITRHSIGDDKICPICQDEFEGAQDVSWCKIGCGNNMHLSCMITYTEYKVASKTAVTCPLCREDWGAKILHSLRDECRAGRPAVKLAVPCCVVCRTKIRSTFFRCLDCTKPELPFSGSEDGASLKTDKQQQWTPTQPPVDTCAACYNRGRRGKGCSEHHTFVASDASSSCWEFKWEAIARPQQLTPRAVEELQTRELTANDYQRLLELCEQLSPPPLQAYLVQWLREGPELPDKCCMCSGDPPAVRSSRQLPCGDCVHHHCLLNAVTAHHATHPQSMDQLACPQCKNPLFSALTRRPVVRKVEPKPEPSNIGSDIPVRGVALGPSRRLSNSDLHHAMTEVLSIREQLQSSLRKPTSDMRARRSEQGALQIVGPRRAGNCERWPHRLPQPPSVSQLRVVRPPTPPRPRPRASEPDLQLAGMQLQHSVRTQREA